MKRILGVLLVVVVLVGFGLMPSTVAASPQSDDFEWGIKGDPLSDSGGGITWYINLAGTTGKVEIDTDKHYEGTRSARFYEDGDDDVEAHFKALGTGQALSFAIYIDGNGEFMLYYGDGSYRIGIRIHYGTNHIEYYYNWEWVDTGVTVSTGSWHTLTLYDIDWSGHSFGIRLDVTETNGAMYVSASLANYIYIYNFHGYGASEFWIDNVVLDVLDTPTVETDACSDATPTSLQGNGNITDDGGGTITRRGFYYTTVFDDFEWGVDEDPLSDDGGWIDWTISAAGNSKAEIDEAQHYEGTRSALLYRDGSNHASAYFSQSPLSTDQVPSFRFRIDGNGELVFAHGNGSYRILFKTLHDVHRIHYYNGATYVDTGVDVSVNEWHIL